MKKIKQEYIIINGLAYDLYKMPLWKRWKVRLKHLLGIRINAL